MPFSDDKIFELFKILDGLGELGPDELLENFTNETVEGLRLLSVVLKEDMEIERVLSEKRFVDIVHELFETKKIWTDRLTETFGNAAQEFESGNRVQALWILNGFIRFCPSPHFRGLAEEVMEQYENQ